MASECYNTLTQMWLNAGVHPLGPAVSGSRNLGAAVGWSVVLLQKGSHFYAAIWPLGTVTSTFHHAACTGASACCAAAKEPGTQTSGCYCAACMELADRSHLLCRYRLGPQPHDLGGQRALDFVLDNPTLQPFNRTLLIDISLLSVRKRS